MEPRPRPTTAVPRLIDGVRRIVVVLAVAGLVLAGCARAPVGGPTPAGTATAAEPVDTGVEYEAPVTGVLPGPDPRRLVIQVTYPTDTGTCYGPPRPYLLEETDTVIFANVVMAPVGSPTPGSCPATGTGTLTTTAPVGTRSLTINQQPWRLAGGGYWRCDTELGCAPSADHCDATWTLQAFNGLDVPRHAGRHIEHCDQQWLVMTVDVNSAACGAGGRPGCSAPPSVARYVFRFATAWVLAARTVTAGCAQIRAAVPEFPEQICASLPATK
jgi:hypothetical protein